MGQQTAVTGAYESLAARVGALVSGPRHARAVRFVVALTVVEAAALSVHLLGGALVTRPRYLLYPFLWVNLVGYALFRAPAGFLRTGRRWAAVGGVVGMLYFALIMWITGTVGFTPSSSMTGLHIVSAPPGWGPVVMFEGVRFHATFVPFQVVGYAGLALLVALAAARTSRSIAAGALGLVSCVGCTLSAVGGLATAVVGGTATVASLTYDVATLAFVLTVVFLLVGIVSTQSPNSY